MYEVPPSVDVTPKMSTLEKKKNLENTEYSDLNLFGPGELK